jgi:hypothetical protein
MVARIPSVSVLLFEWDKLINGAMEPSPDERLRRVLYAMGLGANLDILERRSTTGGTSVPTGQEEAEGVEAAAAAAALTSPLETVGRLWNYVQDVWRGQANGMGNAVLYDPARPARVDQVRSMVADGAADARWIWLIWPSTGPGLRQPTPGRVRRKVRCPFGAPCWW